MNNGWMEYRYSVLVLLARSDLLVCKITGRWFFSVLESHRAQPRVHVLSVIDNRSGCPSVHKSGFEDGCESTGRTARVQPVASCLNMQSRRILDYLRGVYFVEKGA